MQNLDHFNVQELEIAQKKEIDGGFPPWWALEFVAGIAKGYAEGSNCEEVCN